MIFLLLLTTLAGYGTCFCRWPQKVQILSEFYHDENTRCYKEAGSYNILQAFLATKARLSSSMSQKPRPLIDLGLILRIQQLHVPQLFDHVLIH
jgi:hypothetical protein